MKEALKWIAATLFIITFPIWILPVILIGLLVDQIKDAKHYLFDNYEDFYK